MIRPPLPRTADAATVYDDANPVAARRRAVHPSPWSGTIPRGGPIASAHPPSHQARHTRLAFLFALLAALLWGLLPLVLRLVVTVLDPLTITWCRFLAAGIVVGAYLAWRRQLPNPARLATPLRALLLVAIAGLTANYTLFALGVRLTSPALAQIVTQLANFFLLLGGLVVFGERFSRLQWGGLALLLAGLATYFNRRLPLLLGVHSSLGLGFWLLVIGALVWACYGLAQKRLLREWTSTQLLWLLYIGGTLLLLPFVRPSTLRQLGGAQQWALAFCCFNTIVAYGAYAEAMHLGEVARVSATVAISPLFTLLGGALAAPWLPVPSVPEIPDLLTLAGAAAVVAGTMLCALGSAAQAGAPVHDG